MVDPRLPGEPVTAAQVTRASVSVDAVQAGGGAVFWVEGRPDEAGRHVLVRYTAAGRSEPLPSHVSVGTGLYGYGGGEYLVDPAGLWYSDAEGGRVYRATGSGPVPVTPDGQGAWYGDFQYVARLGTLMAIREQPDTDTAELVGISSDGVTRLLAGDADFLAAPRTSPDGTRLAWLSWNDPWMPWDSSFLHTATLDHSGTLTDHQVIAGGDDESVFCPQWAPDGALYFVSDRGGWWNLYRHHAGHVEPVMAGAFETGVAQWELGYTTYAFLPGGAIAVIVQTGPRQQLLLHRPTGTTEVDLPYTSLKPYLAGDGHRLALIGSHPTQLPTIAIVDTITGQVTELTTHDTPFGTAQVSTPEPFTFPTRDGATCHGLYHPPAPTSRLSGPPPLIVRAHPGPTTNAPLRLDPRVAFFTSHGYAVADIDYRGSTGYGRAYRNALRGRWGTLDATDCIDAARYLVHTGRAHHTRIAISGASAGGYTALHALIQPDNPFAAGTAHSPVIDPTHWRATVPRFQRRHTDTLIGSWPRTSHLHRERSLLNHAANITAAVLLTHGTADPITPASDSTSLAAALHRANTPCELLLLLGEGHYPNAPTVITAELHHYNRHLR